MWALRMIVMNAFVNLGPTAGKRGTLVRPFFVKLLRLFDMNSDTGADAPSGESRPVAPVRAGG